MTTTHPRGAAGQAAAELTALVAVIALMVAVLAVWLPGMRLGDPPPVIPQVSRALAAGGDGVPHAGIPSVRELLRTADRHDPFDAIAGWLDHGDGWLRAVPLNRAGVEVLRGARDEMRDELLAALDDPVGYGHDLVSPPSLDDLRELASGARNLPDYLRELRGMDRDEAVMRVSHDAGRIAARAGIVWLRRRISRSVLRRAGRAPPPQEHRGGAP
ncbi:MAG: hypothetical protein U0237_03420 [Thermoleophilia bacterium]